MAAKVEVLPARVLETLIDELTMRVFWKDTESRYLGCNQAFARDAGLEPEDIIGRLDTELSWKAQAEAYRADDRAVMQSGVPRVGFEEQQTGPDGRLLWLRTSKIPLRSTEGAIVGVLGVYEDITNQKELGLKLEERERHLRALLDALPFMAWLKDGDSRYLTANQTLASAALVASPELMVGRTDLDFFPHEVALRSQAEDRAVVESGRPRVLEAPFLLAGRRTWFETYKAPIRQGERIIGTVGYSRDISERMARQESDGWTLEGGGVQVRVVRAFQDTTLAFPDRVNLALSCFDGMRGLRPGGNARLVLPGADPSLGCAALTGGGLWNHAEPIDRTLTVVDRCELDSEHPHGHYFVPLDRAREHVGTLVLDTEPNPTRHPARLEALDAIGEAFVKAIDAERTAQLLHAARVHAEEASLAKSRFLATMSHELRTPLNGILGMAQLLNTGALNERERAEGVSTILQSGKALLSLLNDILDLSKVEAGKLTLDAAPFDASVLLGEVRQLFHELARAKGLTLTTSFDGPALLVGDSLRLRQMLSNLVTNAIKFTATGGVRLSARIRETKPHDPAAPKGEPEKRETVVVEWEVSDDGVGIAPQAVERLFHPFSQLDASATRRFGGTGLGLSIVRHLAENMGGTVGVESELGRGSRFWFTTQLEVGAPPRPEPIASSTVERFEGRRVLVVEDNPINRLVAERMLRRHGVEVASVEDGLAAVEQLTHPDSVFDLVLMDCQMPELDGLDATRRVRTWERLQPGQRHVPIVALTASAFDEDRERTREAGMDDFLTKPIDARLLAERLSSFLR
ncbi:MAG: PAS domain-containing protein [Archangiaceae bacterium]|nr:PAS domain-containing protein [Archangiaceae bacterium]